MKKLGPFTATLLLVCQVGVAQEAVISTTIIEPNVQVTPQPRQPVTDGNVVIINQGLDTKAAVSNIQAELEKQPTTVIESSPLVESRAEQLRKQREQAEVETEQKIVERLEQSRIEAERQRQQEILGSFESKKEETKTEPIHYAAPVVVPAPVPVEQVVQHPVVSEKQTEHQAEQSSNLEDVRTAVREELNALSTTANIKEEKKANDRYFVSGIVGVLDYDSVDVETIGSAGVNIGRLFDDRWMVDLTFLNSRAYVNESRFLFREMQQYNLGVNTKFVLLPGRVRPTIGFGIDFVNRQYSDVKDAYFNDVVFVDDLSSWALDYSFSLGVDLALANQFSIGVEYKYANNLTYEYSDESLNTPVSREFYNNPIEERGAQYLGFSMRYLF